MVGRGTAPVTASKHEQDVATDGGKKNYYFCNAFFSEKYCGPLFFLKSLLYCFENSILTANVIFLVKCARVSWCVVGKVLARSAGVIDGGYLWRVMYGVGTWHVVIVCERER